MQIHQLKWRGTKEIKRSNVLVPLKVINLTGLKPKKIKKKIKYKTTVNLKFIYLNLNKCGNKYIQIKLSLSHFNIFTIVK